MAPKARASLVQSLPTNIRQKIVSHYLWSLSKEGQTTVNREEPSFSQGLSVHPSIGINVQKSSFY
jgi:hypothetical protein